MKTSKAITKPAKAKKEAPRRTPYLEINLEQIGRAYRDFKRSMPDAGVFYAMKCNPHPRILQHLSSLGSSFEIASATELDQLVAVGVDPREVLYSNPVKPIQHIARAHRAGVWRFAFDSRMELEKIAEAAPGAAVYVRIAAPRHDSMVPSEGKFGIDGSSALTLLQYARSLGLRPHGISFHVGSQMEHPEPWEFAIKESASLMERLLAHDIKLQMLNIGGGFPSHYGEEIPEIAEYGASISRALLKHLPYKLSIVAEPGRYLAAEAGVLVATVIGIAERFGKTWVHVDVGAFNGMMEALETQNALHFPLTDSRQDRETALYHLTGPTCDSQDTLLFDATLSANLAINDKVFIHSAGAYITSYA
ncbi:MAG TPA: type III PLP-dependent enzyme, partial [Candidatus Polarisedimenticolaceae bacterium]|nr:type III PLP-dependent enzyme [Candidatus Polarisedimenticolaceae bacterium]